MREPKIITDLRHKVEHEWFGTLTRFGSRLGIPVSKLRVFFIYSTFATAGFFFLVYLFRHKLSSFYSFVYSNHFYYILLEFFVKKNYL